MRGFCAAAHIGALDSLASTGSTGFPPGAISSWADPASNKSHSHTCESEPVALHLGPCAPQSPGPLSLWTQRHPALAW